MKIKKSICLLLCLCLLPANIAAAVPQQASQMLEACFSSMAGDGLGFGDEWAVIALARGGAQVPQGVYEGYLSALYAHLQAAEGRLHRSKYTEYSRVALALAALGHNPADFCGYNLLAPLADMDTVVRQGVTGAAYAAIAISAADSVCPQPAETVELIGKYTGYMLENRRPDGGFALGENPSDPDATAIVLQALAIEGSSDDTVAQVVALLAQMQRPGGGYQTISGQTSESISQVIIALCAAGQSPADAAFFTATGIDALSALSAYYLPGKGFCHMAGGGADGLATVQAALALAALWRFENGLPGICSMADAVYVEFRPVSAPMPHQDVRVPPTSVNELAFTDAPESSYPAVYALACRGIITGYPDGSFGPQGEVTRAELAAMLVRALGLTAQGEAGFSDLPAWCSGYVAAAVQYGIANGRSQQQFDPSSTVTLQEAAVMLAGAARLCGIDTAIEGEQARDILSVYPDYISVADWAARGLAFCLDAGIITESGSLLGPGLAVDRAHAAQFIHSLLGVSGLCD